jgi:dUTP pyrophosphatase
MGVVMSSFSSDIEEIRLMVRIHPDCPHKNPILPPVKPGDVGYDLLLWTENSHNGVRIEPHEMMNIRTGVYIKIPEGYWGAIRPRSSTFARKKLFVMGGTIDEGYTGEISIFIWNPMNKECKVENGDRLAQLVLMKRYTPDIEIVGELPKTERGESGFGSSGM